MQSSSNQNSLINFWFINVIHFGPNTVFNKKKKYLLEDQNTVYDKGKE